MPLFRADFKNSRGRVKLDCRRRENGAGNFIRVSLLFFAGLFLASGLLYAALGSIRPAALKTDEILPFDEDVQILNINGTRRRYLLLLPPDYGPSSSEMPFVLFFHKGKARPEQNFDQRWNNGRVSRLASADDMKHVNRLIDGVVKDYRAGGPRPFASNRSFDALQWIIDFFIKKWL